MGMEPGGRAFVGRIDGLVYEPWVGADFNSQRLRLFFVGNSHYGDDLLGEQGLNPGLTIEVVERVLNEGGLRFFTNCIQLATGMHRDYVDWSAFFDRIGFANLLQYPLGASRVSAPAADLKSCVPAMRAVLEEVAPTHVILFGEQVWSAFLEEGEISNYRNEDDLYYAEGQNFSYFYSQHPSSGFSYQKWSGIFARYLVKTGVPRADVKNFVGSVRFTAPSRILQMYDRANPG